jgi:hypothetical protein
MSQTNSIAVSIPEADLAEIRGAIGVLRSKLAPHLRSLTPQDRRELPKMGDRTMGFVQKAYEYGKNHAELAPNYLDFQALEVDVKAVELLRELSMSLDPLNEALNDSLTLSGSEAYQGALLFYGSVKAAAKAKAHGAEAIYEDLSGRFPGGVQKKQAVK